MGAVPKGGPRKRRLKIWVNGEGGDESVGGGFLWMMYEGEESRTDREEETKMGNSL